MAVTASPATPAQQLVIGSLDRADQYQRVLTELQSAGASVTGEMVDRLLDNGESLKLGPTC